MANAALFLDRDGTILQGASGNNNDTENEGLGYLTELEQVELIEGADEAISSARKLGYKIIVITNQSAIARGWLSEDKLHSINQKMFDLLSLQYPSATVDDLFYCPYHIDGVIEKYRKNSPMRKPDTGMVIEAQKKYNIDLAASYFIGDSFADMKCGDNAGTKKILVLTGYGQIAYQKCLDENLKIDFIAEDLLDAVNFIEKSGK
ncbi:MAG: D-glycero-alpha-D-manno-heptose-1,7-bisphosphate 7-phosphatase [Ignavibacteria bacterium]